MITVIIRPKSASRFLALRRDRYPKRRLVAFFQLRTSYTRTQSLWNDFAHAFEKADHVYVMDIYPAGEEAIPGVTSDLIIKAMQKIHRSRERGARTLFAGGAREGTQKRRCLSHAGRGGRLEGGRTVAGK